MNSESHHIWKDMVAFHIFEAHRSKCSYLTDSCVSLIKHASSFLMNQQDQQTLECLRHNLELLPLNWFIGCYTRSLCAPILWRNKFHATQSSQGVHLDGYHICSCAVPSMELQERYQDGARYSTGERSWTWGRQENQRGCAGWVSYTGGEWGQPGP